MLQPKYIIQLLAALLVCVVLSCRREPEKTQHASEATPTLRKTVSVSRENCELRYLPAPERTPLNDPFEITIDAFADEDAEIDINTEGLKKDFTVNLKPELPEKNGERPFQQHFSLTLEPLWHGNFTLPETIVSFSFKNRPPIVLTVPEQRLTVLEPTQDEQQRQLDDTAARTILDVKPPSKPFLPWLIGTLVALLALAAVILLIRKRKHPDNNTKVAPAVPPHLTALHRLDALLAQNLVEQGLHKEFYNAISEILRDYIEARFGLRAPERTTEEFLEELRNAPNILSARHLELLCNFLNHTDLVKYARATPNGNETSRLVDDTRAFILETIPEPTQTPTPKQ